MKKILAMALAAAMLFVVGCDDGDDVEKKNADSHGALFETVKGSWKSGHAVYTITDAKIDFDHFDEATGVEDFGFEMTIVEVINNEADSTVAVITEIDTITTKAGWMAEGLDGYAAFYVKNIVPGTNADLIRIGTPGYAKDPLYSDVATAKAAAFPADTLKFWKTYDPK